MQTRRGTDHVKAGAEVEPGSPSHGMPAATRSGKGRRERGLGFRFPASTTVSKSSSTVLGHEVRGSESWQTRGTSAASEGHKFLYRRAGQGLSNGCVCRGTGGVGRKQNTGRVTRDTCGPVSCRELWGAQVYDWV